VQVATAGRHDAKRDELFASGNASSEIWSSFTANNIGPDITTDEAGKYQRNWKAGFAIGPELADFGRFAGGRLNGGDVVLHRLGRMRFDIGRYAMPPFPRNSSCRSD